MMRRITSILSVSIFLFSVSCSEELTPTPYTYTQFFTGENSKTWKIKFFEETSNGNIVDRFSVACTSDDQYIFYAGADRLFETTSGSRKCSDEAGLISDSWTFSNATATLTMILPVFSPDFSLPFIVKKLDKKDMVLEIFFDDDAGSYRIHFEATAEN
ncbi:MAG: hypothetical protein JNM57_11795 [Cyclobacteriaceae bacterium]|nr:hypothetical protein [Cyclobacteriaceae bacterium]